MSGKFKPTPADPGTLRLCVVAMQHGQFAIENGPGSLHGEFDRHYVHVSGYFGPHSPWVFAAAPELLEALEAICAEAENMSMTMRRRAIFNAGRAAIARATGAA
jgi:hypothetical protein